MCDDVLPAVSLFSGAGGLDLGIEQAGAGRLQFRAWIESDPDARATLEANRPELLGHPAFFRDVAQVEPAELMRHARLAPHETFLLVGGPPCQAFSTAGLRQTVNDQNGKVVQHYFDMVRELRPRFFVFENVRGLLSAALKHRPLTERLFPQEVPDDKEAQLGSVLQRLVLPSFRRLGYEVVFGLLNAADYGTAQVRHRLFVIGSRDRELRSAVYRKQTSRPMMPLDLVPPTHHVHAPYPPIKPWRTLRDAIGHLADQPLAPEDAYTYSQERAAVFAQIPPGKNWTYVRNHPQLFVPGYLERIMGGAFYSGGGKEGFWRRLAWDKPTPTLTAQPQQLSTSLCHPEHERPLSIPEYAALQDFPPEYRIVGSKSARYKLIGNAVPVQLARALGCVILSIAGVAAPCPSHAKLSLTA